MCGIIGTLSRTKRAQKRAPIVARALLIDNQERGTDSTGIFYLKNGAPSLLKRTLQASDFTLKKSEIFSEINSPVILGHTRYATTGAISERNAHPFDYLGTVFVHNGIISNHAEIARIMGLDVYEVDSEVLGPVFHNKDWNVLAKIQGQAAVLAWNGAELLVYRHGNPLYMVRDSENLYFSSREMQLFIMTGKTPVEVTPDIVYSVSSELEMTELQRVTLAPVQYATTTYTRPPVGWNTEEEDDEEEKAILDTCEVCGLDCTWEELQESFERYSVGLCQYCIADYKYYYGNKSNFIGE